MFLVPLCMAVLGACLAEGLVGPRPMDQLLGALAGLAAGIALAVLSMRLLGRARRGRA